MNEQEIADMLAQANAQAGTGALANIDADGAVIDKDFVAETQISVQQKQQAEEEKDVIVPRAKAKVYTQEELIAIAVKHENATIDEHGNVVYPEADVSPEVKPDDVPAVEPEVSLEGKTLEEQLAIIQGKLDVQNEVVANPLEAVESKLAEAKVDVSTIEAEYLSTGALSEDTLLSLKNAGFDEVAVSSYVDMKQAEYTKRSDAIIAKTTGTRENFDKMATWMNETMTPTAIDVYEKAILVNNGQHAEVYVKSMYDAYQKANPVAPVVIRQSGANQTANVQTAFKNVNEMSLAMADYRYGTDIKYTQNVRNMTARMT